MALKRLNKELRAIRDNPSPYYTASPVEESDLFKWTATIRGPEGTVYENGVFPMAITFPSNYPFSPPRVVFTCKIYHPGVNSNGATCIEMTDPNEWRPTITLPMLLLEHRQHLSLLTDLEPLVPDIYRVLTTDRSLFEKTAREWTKLYASPPDSSQPATTCE